MREAYALTPEGLVDDPFTYVFDGRTLTDGGNPTGLTVEIDGEWDFLLRRIANAPSIEAALGQDTGILLRGFSRSQLFSDFQRLPNNYTVAPQLLYPRNSYISWDMRNVLRQNRVTCGETPILTSFLCFQGVRRRPGSGSFAAYRSGYQYYERPFTYRQLFTVTLANFSTPGNLNPFRTFNVPISDYDFELQQIRIVRTTLDVETGLPFPVEDDEIAIRLYDASNWQALSNRPVPIGVYNANQGSNFFSMFPCPTLVYPVNSQIKFDVESFLCADVAVDEVPREYEINFIGVMRIP
jgi:hypothetical protein